MKFALDTNLLVCLLTNDDRVQAALVETWLAENAIGAGPADFSQYLLAARARNAGCDTVLTLDRKAAKTATHGLLK